jgi:hypothetical protein
MPESKPIAMPIPIRKANIATGISIAIRMITESKYFILYG